MGVDVNSGRRLVGVGSDGGWEGAWTWKGRESLGETRGYEGVAKGGLIGCLMPREGVGEMRLSLDR